MGAFARPHPLALAYLVDASAPRSTSSRLRHALAYDVHESMSLSLSLSLSPASSSGAARKTCTAGSKARARLPAAARQPKSVASAPGPGGVAPQNPPFCGSRAAARKQGSTAGVDRRCKSCSPGALPRTDGPGRARQGGANLYTRLPGSALAAPRHGRGHWGEVGGGEGGTQEEEKEKKEKPGSRTKCLLWRVAQRSHLRQRQSQRKKEEGGRYRLSTIPVFRGMSATV